MPRPTRQGPAINPAVAALGVGIQPDRWDIKAVVDTLTRRYTQLVQQADEAHTRAQNVRRRVVSSGAYELAQLLAEYYRDQNDAAAFMLWSRRKDRAYYQAYHPSPHAAWVHGAADEADPADS